MYIHMSIYTYILYSVITYAYVCVCLQVCVYIARERQKGR